MYSALNRALIDLRTLLTCHALAHPACSILHGPRVSSRPRGALPRVIPSISLGRPPSPKFGHTFVLEAREVVVWDEDPSGGAFRVGLVRSLGLSPRSSLTWSLTLRESVQVR